MECFFGGGLRSRAAGMAYHIKIMAKTFYILNHPLCPTPYTHRFFVNKFASGFTFFGYDVKLISSPDEIDRPGVMMIYDAAFYFYWNNGIRNLRRDFFIIISRLFEKAGSAWFQEWCWHLRKTAILQCAPYLKKHGVVVLGWFWFKQKEFFEKNKIDVIYTGEYLCHHPNSGLRVDWWQYYNDPANHDAIPIRFAAAMDPAAVGTLTDIERDIVVSYVGERRYRPDWQALFAGRNDCRIVPTPPYIGEEERIDIYKRSMVSLGLEGPALLEGGLVTERVFEAFAYGAICITNHPEAVAETGGAAVFARDTAEVARLVDHFKNDKMAADRQRMVGFAFAKKEGTYMHQAKKFIEHIEKYSK